MRKLSSDRWFSRGIDTNYLALPNDKPELELEYNKIISAHLMTWDWKTDIVFGVRF